LGIFVDDIRACLTLEIQVLDRKKALNEEVVLLVLKGKKVLLI
jgi:hypothetical protein